MTEPIKIRGLRQNNLKNISLDIPKNKIVVFTGVSGSGKSSIVFDTVAAESQRQMNETYTAWVRGRLPKYEKPNVELIDNLNPSVIIDQSRLGGNARSTVGTISDMYSLLRLLFSRIGTGLHAADIEKVVGILESFVDRGNTVIVIEHNTDVMKLADYIIDIGPDGGTKGGEVVFTGTPREMYENGTTITAKYLRK